MNLLDPERKMFLIFVGSFNDENNQGFTLYQFDPEEKMIFFEKSDNKGH